MCLTDHCYLLGLSITLLSGKGLIIPPPPSAAGLNIPGNGIFGGLYAKCKVVDRDGHSNDKSTADSRTPNISPSADPVWKDATFVRKANSQGYNSGEYMRVELFIEYLTSNTSIGAIFVPFEYFLKKTTEYTFPIVKYRQGSTLLAGSTALVPSTENTGVLSFICVL